MVKKYYWLKLNDNFFEDDTMTWLGEQKNGKDYIIFYLKLCLKSLKDDGKLIRYVGEKLMPYDVNSLARLTNTPVDTVAVAMKVFDEIGLVTIYGTGEIYMQQINEMIGSETDTAKRVRQHRARQSALEEPKETEALHCNTDVTKCNTEIEIEKEIDTELEKEIDYSAKKRRFTPPKVDEVAEYCQQRNKGVDAQRFVDFYTAKNWMIGKNKMTDWKAAVRTWEGKQREQPKATYTPEEMDSFSDDAGELMSRIGGTR